MITYHEAFAISASQLLVQAAGLYGLYGYTFNPVQGHEGGRNLVYTCDRDGAESRILRIAFLEDRTRKDILAEAEYVRYLCEHGASVANVIDSLHGRLMEEVVCQDHTFYLCLFEKAKGKMLVDNRYQYRKDAPICEYYHTCGKVLGKLHQLSKEYVPIHRRYDFFDKYTSPYIEACIPAALPKLKAKLHQLLCTLKEMDRDGASYGMVHFDYSDGNYHIDFDNGDITVYDFDNACFCWYMYDLANLWTHGVGWIQFEEDVEKRRSFMKHYFQTVLKGYRAQTDIEEAMLEQLPLFIRATEMENILDAFETMRRNGEGIVCDEELAYLIKCVEDDIPYKGFFHEMYSCQEPFSHEPLMI